MWGATLGPVGWWPWGPGTLASIAVAVAWAAWPPGPVATGVLAAAVALVGVPLSAAAERALGPDDGRIVVDEAAGMLVALLGAPAGWGGAAVACALFRLFDIVKPPPVGLAERAPRGWGVVLDDVVAGGLAAGTTGLAFVLASRIGG